MKFSILAVTVAVLAYIGLADAWAPDATCKEFIGVLTKKQLGGISTCSKSMKFKNPKEKAAKMNCILKCVLINEKMLDANGKMVDGDVFNSFLEDWVPGNLKDLAVPRLTKCKDVGVADGDDEFCKSYDPLIKCMLDVVGTLCK